MKGFLYQALPTCADREVCTLSLAESGGFEITVLVAPNAHGEVFGKVEQRRAEPLDVHVAQNVTEALIWRKIKRTQFQGAER